MHPEANSLEQNHGFDVQQAEEYRIKMERLLSQSTEGYVQGAVLEKRKALLQKYGSEVAKSYALFHILFGKADTIAEQPILHDDFLDPDDSIIAFVDNLENKG